MPRNIKFKSTKRYNNKSIAMGAVNDRPSMRNPVTELEAVLGDVERRLVGFAALQLMPIKFRSDIGRC